MNHFTQVSTCLVVSSIASLYFPFASLAQSSASTKDLLCYLQTDTGKIINLGKLCGYSQPGLSTIDQQFLDTYKGFLSKRSKNLPSVVAAFSQLHQSPQTVVERAKGVCAVLKSGTLSQDQLPQNMIDSDLINAMAVEYYCPELDD